MGSTASVKVKRDNDENGWAKRARIFYKNRGYIIKICAQRLTNVVSYRFSIKDPAETVILCQGWLILTKDSEYYYFIAKNVRGDGTIYDMPTAATIFQYVCPRGAKMPQLYSGTVAKMIHKSL